MAEGDCYWDLTLESEMCKDHVLACTKMVSDQKTFTSAEYEQLMDDLESFLVKSKKEILSTIDASTEDFPALQSSVASALTTFSAEAKTKIDTVKQKLQPLAEDYTVLYDTPSCPHPFDLL